MWHRSERKETIPTAAAFIEGGEPRPRPCEEGQARERERATVAHSGEKLKAPTPSNSRARRTHALISQAKRPIQQGRDGTAVSSPRAPRLQRSALKSYVRAVPSRGRGARPPADQASQEGHRRTQFPTRPTPSRPRAEVARWSPVGHRFRLARPPTLQNEAEKKSLSRPKIPRPWPPTFQRLRD